MRTEPGADIAGLVSELRARQNDAGAYKLWPGSEQVVEFVALYAQHFLLEAAERDEPVPGDLIASGNSFLRSVAARDGNNLTDERQSAYAIYLLTRQGHADVDRDRRSSQTAGGALSRPVGTGSHGCVARCRVRPHAPGSRRRPADRSHAVRSRHDERHVQRSDDARRAAVVRDGTALPGAPARRAEGNADDARAARERQLLPFVVGRHDFAGARCLLERDAGRRAQSRAG